MFLYEFAEKTAQKPDTVATYVRRNKKIFKNHVERRQKQIWLDEKAVDILLKKYPEVQKKQKKPLNKEKFEEIITKSLKTLYENQEILAKEIDEIRALVEELEESFDHKQAEQQKEDFNSLFVFFFDVFFVHFSHIFSPFWLFLIRSMPCLARSFTSSGILSVSICTTDTAVQRKPTILRPILIF